MIYFKFERDELFFDDFFISIIVMSIWKICLFENILMLEIIARTKE